MKKIAIITINDTTNYGNRLQNYAMQELLGKLDLKAFTIRTENYRDLLYIKTDKMLYIKIYIIRLWEMLRNRNKRIEEVEKQSNLLLYNRILAFEKFNEKYIEFYAKTIKSEFVSRRVIKEFQYFVTGSDQVWNPTYWIGKHTMYLQFAPKKKRIAIAPSFGVSCIPEKEKKIVTRYLNDMQYISVREDSGRRIVKELTGRECDLIMDPTLLVDSSKWECMVADAEVRLPQRYMLAYFLGDVSEEKKDFIVNVARNSGCELVWMNSETNEEIYSWGPEKFIKAIHGCECFFTDSFHGCVFSILFHRQFFVFRREGVETETFDRIDTLLSKMNLTNHIVELLDRKILEECIITETQYTEIDFKLKEERKKVQKILEKVFG